LLSKEQKKIFATMMSPSKAIPIESDEGGHELVTSSTHDSALLEQQRISNDDDDDELSDNNQGADDDAYYETIYEDIDSEFIMVPNSVLLPEEEYEYMEQTEQLPQSRYQSLMASMDLSSWSTSSSVQLASSLRDHVSSAASTGMGWIKSSGRKMKRSILRSAARTNHKMTEQFEWVSDTTVSGGWTDGGECRLLLPGQLIVLGDTLCASPLESSMSLQEGDYPRPEVNVDESPTKVMVSAHDLLAMSSSNKNGSTSESPRGSKPVMSTREMQVTEALLDIFRMTGFRMAYSAKRKIKRATSSGISLLKTTGAKLASIERKYNVIETAGDLIADGCEKLIKPFQPRQQSGSEEDIAIELTT
jgi:hypothetical protein